MRKSYERIVFEPESSTPNCYNLWQGFSCDARPGNCDMFFEHLHTNLCRGIEEHYNYLLGWMATCVQHPARAGQVAVVMRGPKGTGKSFFAGHFGHLFGRHYLPVSNPQHLVGNFNSHLRDALVVFADEAFFAGDKKHESVLKSLITERHIHIEAKGYDAELVANYTHLIMASNEDWVVPASGEERRYFVLEVGSDRQQDISYFGAMEQQLLDGGYEAMLHNLLTYDLSGFEVRNAPRTEGLQSQKELSLKPEEAWWLSCLEDGQIGDSHWPSDRITSGAVRDAYTDHVQKFKILRPLAPK